MGTKTTAVYVYGSGGHGKVVATVLQAEGLQVKGFLDDDLSKAGGKLLSLTVFEGRAVLDEEIKSSPSLGVIVGIGDNAARRKIFEQLTRQNIPLVSSVHPSVIRHSSVTIGRGTVVMAGGILNVDSRIGENVILNTGVSIDHDCVIANHAHLAPGVILSGHVTIGEEAFLGVGARVIPGIAVGSRAIVGAGAVVLENVPADAKVAGVPAKSLVS